MRQDPAFKDVFAYGFMVEELMRWFVGDLHGARDLVDALDCSRLLRVQEQSTTGRAADKRCYANDVLRRVPFQGRAADDEDRTWLHPVLMIEVQGEVDHLMALRVRNYVDNHHLEIWRGRRFGAADRLAPVLPIVIYTGPSRWTAAVRVIDLVARAAGRAGVEAVAGDGAARGDADIGLDLGIDDMAGVDRLHGSGELEAFFAARRRAYEDRYRAEGIEQGLAAERKLLRRLAESKFGTPAPGSPACRRRSKSRSAG